MIIIIMSIACGLRQDVWPFLIVLRSGLQQVTTGPRSLFSFLKKGQYFP